MFADGVLTHAWVLTTAREEPRNRAALVAHYGEAIRIFDGETVTSGAGAAETLLDRARNTAEARARTRMCAV